MTLDIETARRTVENPFIPAGAKGEAARVVLQKDGGVSLVGVVTAIETVNGGATIVCEDDRLFSLPHKNGVLVVVKKVA